MLYVILFTVANMIILHSFVSFLSRFTTSNFLSMIMYNGSKLLYTSTPKLPTFNPNSFDTMVFLYDSGRSCVYVCMCGWVKEL